MSSGADGGSAVWREREKKIKRRNEATAAKRGGPRPAAGPPAPAQVGRGGTRLPVPVAECSAWRRGDRGYLDPS